MEGKDTEKTMMAAAHMDEIGFMVRHIDDKGFIKFLPLGGFDAKTLTAQRVIVHGKKDLIGVMGVKPIHVMSPAERTKLPEVTDFFIDLGMSKEEVEKYVSVGDSVTRERDLVEMGDCVNVKSLDNRAGCYVLIEALRAIKASKKKPSCNFVAAFTVQEEVGLRGAPGRHAGHPAGLLHRAGRHHRLRHSRHPGARPGLPPGRRRGHQAL